MPLPWPQMLTVGLARANLFYCPSGSLLALAIPKAQLLEDHKPAKLDLDSPPLRTD